jgi:hypothetical protein
MSKREYYYGIGKELQEGSREKRRDSWSGNWIQLSKMANMMFFPEQGNRRALYKPKLALTPILRANKK